MKIKSVKSFNPCLSGRQAFKLVIKTGYDIVKAHGVELKVESKNVEATIFTIQLPKI